MSRVSATLSLPSSPRKTYHRLAERAGSEEAYSAIVAPKFDSYSGK